MTLGLLRRGGLRRSGLSAVTERRARVAGRQAAGREIAGREADGRRSVDRRVAGSLLAVLLLVASPGPVPALGAGEAGTAQDRPALGQEGKNVEWIPSPDALVATMLRMAQVTPDDFVVDLGSGDGRTVIEAARLGAQALGVEYDPALVAVSRERAAAAGVSGRARFLQADLFEVDLSEATVVTLFLLPDLNLKLRPRLLQLAPGTRVLSNTWDMGDWAADETVILDPCPGFCTALLWTVPAQVGGAWTTSDGSLTLSQQYHTVAGTLRTGGEQFEVEDGRLSGAELSFRAGGARYQGRVSGDTVEGTVVRGDRTDTWRASRAP